MSEAALPLPHSLRRKSSALCKGIVVFALAFSCSAARTATLTGTAERITDGDTMRIRSADRTTTTIRLAGIDAPEKKQPYGRAAGRRFAALCLGKSVEADFRATDRYGRTVARVRCDGNDAGRTLIAEGLAWHYARYAKTQPREEARADAAAEAAARVSKLGLWDDPEPQAPWDFRKASRSRQTW